MGTLTTKTVREGLKVRAYGFNCLPSEDETVIICCTNADFFFPCAQGKHWLIGQLDDDSEEYVGLDLIPPLEA